MVATYAVRGTQWLICREEVAGYAVHYVAQFPAKKTWIIFVEICNFSSTEAYQRKNERLSYKLIVLAGFLDQKRPSKDEFCSGE